MGVFYYLFGGDEILRFQSAGLDCFGILNTSLYTFDLIKNILAQKNNLIKFALVV